MRISTCITLSCSVFAERTTVGDVLVTEIVLQGVLYHTLIAFAGCFAVVSLTHSYRLVAEVVLERETSETFLANSDIHSILVGHAVLGFWLASVVYQHVAALT